MILTNIVVVDYCIIVLFECDVVPTQLQLTGIR